MCCTTIVILIVMENSNRKSHWENIYSTKNPNEVSWTQDIPQTSLDFIHAAKLHKQANIIDIGGGDSKLVDFLLDEGYENITVLDISEEALAKAKRRLGPKADKVKWIATDILDFVPTQSYDFWHDRAAFHFLTSDEQIITYIAITRQALGENGTVTIGAFSEKGPKKCSGLDIKQYSEQGLIDQLGSEFEKINCVTEDHITPFGTVQNFLFCSFKKI